MYYLIVQYSSARSADTFCFLKDITAPRQRRLVYIFYYTLYSENHGSDGGMGLPQPDFFLIFLVIASARTVKANVIQSASTAKTVDFSLLHTPPK